MKSPSPAFCSVKTGSLLAAAGFEEKIRVYDVRSGAQRFELICPCRDMRALAFSPDNQILAAGGRNGQIRLWTSVDGQHVRDLTAHRKRIRQLAFTQQGDQIISCSEDRTVRVSNITGIGGFALPRRPTKIMAMAHYAPGRLATAGSDNMIRLWDLTTKAEIGHLRGHTGSIVTLEHDQNTLVSGSYDTTVRIWNMQRVAGDVGQPAGRIGSTDKKTGFE